MTKKAIREMAERWATKRTSNGVFMLDASDLTDFAALVTRQVRREERKARQVLGDQVDYLRTFVEGVRDDTACTMEGVEPLPPSHVDDCWHCAAKQALEC